MNHKQDNLIVVLDIGSAWTRVLAADLADRDARACVDDHERLELRHRQVELQQGRQAEPMQAGIDGVQIIGDGLDMWLSTAHLVLAG